MAKVGTSAERVRRRRAKLRESGLRPVQLWLPDTRAAGFAEACALQARLIRDSEACKSEGECEGEAQGETWFEVSDETGWTA